ncbi:putative HTH-type transcriptional regulator YurK [Bienertia sinuspersici]
MVKNLATQIGQVHNQGVQYQQKTDIHLQNIDTQIGQICTSLSNLESQISGKLPSQPHPNPKEQVNRVILRDPEEANELEELEVISEESRRPFLKTSKALIDVANGSVVLESNGEKIELNMIDKDLIPEANATNYVANSLEQIGVDNLEIILDGMIKSPAYKKMLSQQQAEVQTST